MSESVDRAGGERSAPSARTEAAFDAGDVVVDRDDDEPSRAVVVNTPAKPASEWHVSGRGKLAEDNPEYAPSNPVVCVVFEDDLREAYPHYAGVKPLQLSKLNADGVKFYAFPEDRLEFVERVGQPVVELERISPSPYHARNFCYEANAEFVEEIGERGHPSPPPLVRVVGDGERFEVVNGHKRLWAAHVAGLDEIPVLSMYATEEEATRAWARRHLDEYEGDELETALDRICERRGSADGLPHVDGE